MQVAVTGANGYVGVNLVDRLVAAGHQVRAFDAGGFERLAGKPVERCLGDVRDPAALSACFRGVEVVFHLAAVISIDGDRDGLVHDVNVRGARAAARAALGQGVRRFVHLSSIQAFDARHAAGPVDETLPRATHAACPAYDRSKALGEQEVRGALADGLDAVVLHPTGVFGPKDPQPSRIGRVLLDACRGRLPVIVEGGFDWVDVRDVADAAFSAANRGQRGASYILSGHHASMEELTRLAASRAGAWRPLVCLPRRFATRFAPLAARFDRARGREPRFTAESLSPLGTRARFSNALAQRELGFAPRPVEASVSDLVDAFVGAGLLGPLQRPDTAGEELQTRFAVHLRAHPVEGEAERELLGRVLVGIALSDGRIEPSERQLLGRFADAALDDPGDAPEPTREELRRLPVPTRVSILLAAIALACCDHDYAPIERAAIERLADALAIDRDLARNLERWAIEFVVDQLLDSVYADGLLDAEEHEQIARCAEALAVSRSELARLDAGARRRRGLAPRTDAPARPRARGFDVGGTPPVPESSPAA